MRILVIFISVFAAVYAEVQRTSAEASGPTTVAPAGKTGSSNGPSGARSLLLEEEARQEEQQRVGNALGSVPQSFGAGITPNQGLPSGTGNCAGGCICRDALIALGIIGPGSPLFPSGPGGLPLPGQGPNPLGSLGGPGSPLFPVGPGGQPYPGLGPLTPGQGPIGGPGSPFLMFPGQVPNSQGQYPLSPYPGMNPQEPGPFGPYPGQISPLNQGSPMGPYPGNPYGLPFGPRNPLNPLGPNNPLSPFGPNNPMNPLGPNNPFGPNQPGPGQLYPGGSPQYPGGSPQYPGGSPQYPGGSPQYPPGTLPYPPSGGSFPVGNNPFNPHGNTFPDYPQGNQPFAPGQNPYNPQGPQGQNPFGPGGSPMYPDGGSPFGAGNQPGGNPFQIPPFGTGSSPANQNPLFPGQLPNQIGSVLGGSPFFPNQQGPQSYPGQGQNPYLPGNQLGPGGAPIQPFVPNQGAGPYPQPGSQFGSPVIGPFGMQPEGNQFGSPFQPGGPGQGFPTNLTPEMVAQLLQQCVMLQSYMKSQPGLQGLVNQPQYPANQPQYPGNQQPIITGNQFGVPQSQPSPPRYGNQQVGQYSSAYANPNLNNYIKAGLSLLDESGEDGSSDKKSGSKKTKSTH